MVNGIESFQKHFKDYPDCYAIIGGAACDILMTEAELDFRATKDVDMILVLEDRYREFAAVFWEYIKKGGYKCGWKQSEEVHFYRFTEPKVGYPAQIELFSRKPDYHLNADQVILPIHIADDISSLSAILLNDDFYNFMTEGRRTINGLCILDASYLIPFKMFAWLNLTEQKAAGKHVNERDLKKHKNDVFRLLQIIPNNTSVPVSGEVSKSIDMFIEKMQNENLSLSDIGVPLEKQQALEILKTIYKEK